MTQRLQMMFITATSLPLLVALAEIGLRNGTMLPENAAALVGAGVLSVIFYPAIAVAIGARRAARDAGRAHLRGPIRRADLDQPARRARLPRPASRACGTGRHVVTREPRADPAAT